MWGSVYPSSFLSPDWCYNNITFLPLKLSWTTISNNLVVIIRIIYATNVETICFCAFVLRIEAIQGGRSPFLWFVLLCELLFILHNFILHWKQEPPMTVSRDTKLFSNILRRDMLSYYRNWRSEQSQETLKWWKQHKQSRQSSKWTAPLHVLDGVSLLCKASSSVMRLRSGLCRAWIMCLHELNQLQPNSIT